MSVSTKDIQNHWANIRPLLTIRNEREYEKAVKRLNTQSDLSEVGSQGVVSEILDGKRELNIRQIRVLAKRFGVSPAVFI